MKTKKKIIAHGVAALVIIVTVICFLLKDISWQSHVKESNLHGIDAWSLTPLMGAIVVLYEIIFLRSLVVLICGNARRRWEKVCHIILAVGGALALLSLALFMNGVTVAILLTVLIARAAFTVVWFYVFTKEQDDR